MLANVSRAAPPSRLLHVAFGALAWLACARSRADTEPAHVALKWQAPTAAGCATQDEIESEVSRLTEREPATRGPSFWIEAVALLHEGRWVASVALRDERGRIVGGREVSGDYASCRELDLPVALVIATLLDGLRAPEAIEPAPPASSAELRTGKVGVRAFAAGAWGLAPTLAAGIGAGVELPLGWPVSIDATVYVPREQVDGAGRGARAFSVHAGAALCPRLWGLRYALHVCGGAQAGAALARGVGLSESERAAKPLVMLGLEPQLVLGLTASWALQLSLAAQWVAVHPRFHWQIEGMDDGVLATRRFALTARIGIIDFPR